MTSPNPPGNSRVQPRRLLRLLRRMIDIYSPSGKEGDVLNFLNGWLQRRGLPVTRQFLGDGRCNLIVAPPGIEIELALMGHVDTVGAYDLEHLGCEKRGDEILGLGAADMKGGCAALIEAFVSAWEDGYTHLPVALVLVVGEEETGDGTEHLLTEYHFPWALIAEPTCLEPCLAHYGYVEVQLSAHGQRRHASLAPQHSSPVETLLQMLLSVTRHLTEQRIEGTYNIRDLLSSPAGFAVPDWCEAWLDLHLPPQTDMGAVCGALEAAARGAPHAAGGEVDTSVRFHTIEAGYTLPESGAPIRLLRSVFSDHRRTWAPRAFQSHSDANRLWASGVMPILLGPGSLAKAHVPAESVAWAEVEAAAALYRGLIARIGGAAGGP